MRTNRPTIDTSLLQTFADVAASGSFAAVARKEGVDPSSISRRVAALEQALDLTLFERTTRRLALTEAGRIYLERIGPVTDALAEAADLARDAVTAPSGTLRVATSVAFGERWLVPRLAGFQALFPRIHIELTLSDDRVDIAAEGIDVAIRLGPRIEGAFVVSKLFDVRYRAVASPAYQSRAGQPRHPADLHDHDGILFALPGFGSGWQFRQRPGADPIEARPRPVLTVSSAIALRRAALEGLGVALLADWTIDADLASGRLIDLFPEFEGSATTFDTAVWMLYASHLHVPARLRVFLDYVRESAQQV